MVWFRRKATGLRPPRPDLRDPLFADAALAVVAAAGDDDPDTPWTRFHAALASRSVGDVDAAKLHLRSVLDLHEVSTRLHLQAWSCLRELGERPPADRGLTVRGVVVELGEAALETIAAYEDRSAFAILRTGAAIDWVAPDDAVDACIEAMLAAARAVVEHTGPHLGEREHPPEAGHAVIHVLTFAGTHVGTGPMGVLAKDPLGGPVIAAARALQAQLAGRAVARRAPGA